MASSWTILNENGLMDAHQAVFFIAKA